MLDAVLDVVLLRKAFARARSYSPTQSAERQALSAAAMRRVRSAVSLTAPSLAPVRACLFRDALAMRVEAAGVPARVLVRTALDEEEMMLVEDALGAREPLYFDRMTPEALSRLLEALERAERAARRGVEVRSVDHLRAARAGRVAAIAIAVAYVVWRLVHFWVDPPNVAFHKPVTVSRAVPYSALPATLVDGDTDEIYKPFILTGAGSFVAIDLGGIYKLDHVRIFNRKDGGFDSGLPVDLETSTDGRAWTTQTHRRNHFSVWVEPLSGYDARWVRLRTEGNELGLVEIEIYGKYTRSTFGSP